MQTNYYTVLGRILNAYAPVGQDATELILKSGNTEVFRKDETVFHQNRFNEFEYFQLEGISHRYNVDSDKQVLTTGIYQNEIIITPHFARTTNGQSIFSLQALTDCIYLKIPAGAFRELRNQNSQISMFGDAVVEREFIKSLNFESLFRSFTAKERLLYFRKEYPSLENIIPHTVIASFLGITPVSLSRIRNELAK